MKKRTIQILIGFLIVIGIVLFILLIKEEQPILDPIKPTINKEDFYKIEKSDWEDAELKDWYTNYEDFKEDIKSVEISKKDFQNYNFAVIALDYDSCSQYNVTPTKYEVHKNNIAVTVEYNEGCGVCPPTEDYYLLKVDKKEEAKNIIFIYKAISHEKCDPNVSYKPMIYLYPKEKTEVTVQLKNSDNLTTTYPKYNKDWQVTAYPDGTLIDEKNRSYYGLYWEGKNHYAKVEEDGFIVKKEDSISFLEEKLSLLGLTEREANEFIIYWLPKLEENKYNYIRFETKEEIEKYMPLEVTPQPDTMIRIVMNFKPLKETIKVKEQKLETPIRTGFTVVEWGGSIIQ